MSNRQTAANESMTIVTFKYLAVPNVLKTKEAGCPKYDDIEICEIRFAGNREKVGHFPAHEICKTERDMEGNVNELTYAMLYNKEYLAFKSGAQASISGTPTAELPFLSNGKRLELKALNIHTAEALAAVDGNNLKMLGMGGRELKNQAQAYLDKAKEGASAAVLASRIAVLEEQNRQLLARQSGASGNHEAADEPLIAPEDPSKSPFFSMGADDIKNWIQEATGSRPKGNPSHATLVAQADTVNDDLKKKREQAAA